MHSNFTGIESSPSKHSWHQKTRDTGLPDGESRVPLVLTEGRNVTDRQTDGPTDGFAVAYTVFADGSKTQLFMSTTTPISSAVFGTAESAFQRIIIRPRRSRSAAAYSHQTFPCTICRSVCLSVQCIVEKRQIAAGNRSAP